MGDFNYNSLDEYERHERKKAKNSTSYALAKFMVFVFAISFGFIIFLIFNYFINSNTDIETYTELDLNNEDVKILYSYVTYGTRGRRNDKFVYSSYVDSSSFSNQDKFYYALQFVQAEDFVYTGENNSYGKKIYIISDQKIREYMELFFGPNIMYSQDIKMNYAFPFRINKMNVGTLQYNVKKNGYEATFTSFLGAEEIDSPMEDYYTQLVGAKRLDSGVLILKEKIVYVKLEEQNGIYTLSIYKDHNRQKLIDQKSGLVSSQLDSGLINLSSMDDTAYIEYTFALNGVVYYFDHSQIIGE